MATHSCILAWRIPWTEEPGGLWSIESQRVGHVSTLTHIYIIQENPSLLRFLAFLVAQMVKSLPAIQETQFCLILGSGRSPGEGHGNPLQCSYLENSMDRGAWQATVHEVAKSQTRLSH